MTSSQTSDRCCSTVVPTVMKMSRSIVTTALLWIATVGVSGAAGPRAQDASDLTGRWALNRELSQFPHEIGFSVDWLSPGAAGSDSSGGGRGRRGSGGTPGGFPIVRESEDDSKRREQLTAEVRTPPARLTIVDTPAAV